jgi:hypothetical protein
VAQAIKYEVSQIKITTTKLIDESGLQESNPRPYKPSTRSTKKTPRSEGRIHAGIRDAPKQYKLDHNLTQSMMAK